MGGKKTSAKVWVVLYDGGEGSSPGPAGDHTFTNRFGIGKAAETAAKTFAAGKTYLGRPTSAQELEVSLATARRWGFGW